MEPFPVSVGGEYMGTLESLDAAIRKLHPNAILKSECQTRFYSIEELVSKQRVRLTITVVEGRTSVGLKPCYDVYFNGISIDGGCKQLIGRIVTEAGISVITDQRDIYSKLQGNRTPLQEVVRCQIEAIMEHERF